MTAIVPVLVPVALDAPYSYRAPEGLTLAPGAIVQAPLGPRTVFGAVWDEKDGGAEVDRARLREVLAAFDVPPLIPELRRFVDWLAGYYLVPRGMVLRMVLRCPEAFSPEPPLKGVRFAGIPPERMTPARRRVLDLAADGFGWSRPALAAAAGVSPSVIDGLIAAGALAEIDLPREAPARLDPDHAPPLLTPAQAEAAENLRQRVDAKRFSVTLLDGVTGSGKTEVYGEAVAQALRLGRQALVLLPEIALTGEFLRRFELRFGGKPVEWHSEVAPRARARAWRGVATGEARVVVGARSALFLPFRDLGLIVVDEEHDGAYKQEDGVPYHARDMAVVRGQICGSPVVLASATPSIETRVNAEAGRYARLQLPERVAGAPVRIAAIDLRRSTPERGRWLAAPLVAAVASALADGEQALLFLNRRGYAPLTICRACGHRFHCPNCSTWLVEHRFRRQLQCHYCGHAEPRPDVCPDCGAADSLVACGPGVERVAEEAAERFPDKRIVVLSSDFPGGAARLREELQAVARGEADIVIGTQVVAKGHNFPKLSVVGVVDADLGLANGDPRAAEKTFQILAQVTGRAGRTSENGRGFLQTHSPDAPVIRAIVAGDADGFYRAEIDARRATRLPPFGRLAALIVSSEEKAAALAHARALALAAPVSASIQVLGPAEAPIAVVRGRHRFRLLVQAPRGTELQAYMRDWLARAPRAPASVKITIDVDPQSFL